MGKWRKAAAGGENSSGVSKSLSLGGIGNGGLGSGNIGSMRRNAAEMAAEARLAAEIGNISRQA